MIETILFSTVDEYIQISKEKYGYNAEQALGMLFWHKVSARFFEATYYDFLKQEYINVPSSPFQHDLDRAVQDLANSFCLFPCRMCERHIDSCCLRNKAARFLLHLHNGPVFVPYSIDRLARSLLWRLHRCNTNGQAELILSVCAPEKNIAAATTPHRNTYLHQYKFKYYCGIIVLIYAHGSIHFGMLPILITTGYHA